MHAATPESRTMRATSSPDTTQAERVLTTPFVDEFTREFVRPNHPDGPRIWPGDLGKPELSEQFGTVLELLLKAELHIELPTNTGNQLRDRVATFLQGRWPVNTNGLPEAWQDNPQAGRYAEISLVCQALLTAVLNRGGGGGETTIPPHGR